MSWDIGRYKPSDIEVILAPDIDKRKVKKDVNEAIKYNRNIYTIYLFGD